MVVMSDTSDQQEERCYSTWYARCRGQVTTSLDQAARAGSGRPMHQSRCLNRPAHNGHAVSLFSECQHNVALSDSDIVLEHVSLSTIVSI